MGSTSATDDGWLAFQDRSQRLIEFCQRQATTLSEQDRERIWLSLLDQLLTPPAGLDEQQLHAAAPVAALRLATQQVVTSAQGHVALSKILRRVIEDPGQAGATLADLRQLIMGNLARTMLLTSIKFSSSNENFKLN